MAAKNVGTLIREAREAKKLSQTQLASGVDGLSGSDIGKAERGEKELTQTQLKAIAKILGVTQKSLLEAPKGGISGTSSAKAASKARKTDSAAKTSSAAAKKTETAAKKTASASSEKLTAAEKKFLELYRAADSDDKKMAARILKGEKLEFGEILPMLMNSNNSGSGGNTNDDGLLGALMGKLQGLMK